MRKLYTLGLILLVGQIGLAQISHNFKMERGGFEEMTSPVDLLDRGLLEDLSGKVVPIGFDFEYSDDIVVDRLRFTEDGMLEGFNVNDKTAAFTLSVLQSVDMLDRGFQSGINESTVTYSLKGVAGDRMLVIEWNNIGFQKEYDSFQTSEDFASFQLRLVERGHKIEFNFQRSNVSHPELYFGETGPMVGHASNVLGTQNYLIGQGNNPAAVEVANNLNYFPVSGAKFVFRPVITVADTEDELKIAQAPRLNAKVYPNPFLNEMNITLQAGLDPVKLLVTSPYGKVVHEGIISDIVTLDLTGFDPGMYIIRLIGNDQKKVIKAMKR